MPLPVAHALVGATLKTSLSESHQALSLKAISLTVLLAICPDFDYALNFLQIGGGGWHHGFTHSILFAIAIGLLCWLILKDKRPATLFILCAVVVSHTLLDYLFTESRGVALFWPITDYRYKLNWFNPINYSWRSTSISAAVADLARLCVLEMLIFSPVLLLALLIKKRFASK
jgi:inner membrane protein